MYNVFWENVFNASKENLPIIIHPTHPNKEKWQQKEHFCYLIFNIAMLIYDLLIFRLRAEELMRN